MWFNIEPPSRYVVDLKPLNIKGFLLSEREIHQRIEREKRKKKINRCK